MPDIATLGMRVENAEVVRATTSLDSMTVAGTKTEAATQRLTRRMALLEIEARSMDSAMGKSESRVTSLAKAWAAAGGAVAAGWLAHEFIKNTEDAQNAMAQLEAALRASGSTAGRSVEQLDALSMAMQQTTTFSDEAVKGAQAMLLTFDKIQGVNFDRTTQAVADLATRMGGDLNGAAIQLGKALQDPTTGLTALRRSGVSFSAAQIELIKTLYETGRAAEGQTVILKEMEHQFGGSAAAARDTLGGALSHLKNVFGDLFEATRAETSGLVTFINTLGDAIQKVGEYREVIKSTGDALAITGAGAGAFVLALKASEVGIAAFLTAAAPILVLAAAFSVLVIAVQNARDEFRQAQDAEDELTKTGAGHLAYLKALGVAHSQAGGAGALQHLKATHEQTEAEKKAAAALKEVIAAGVLARIAAQREFEAVGMETDALAHYNLATQRMLDLKKAEQTLTGAALTAQKLQIAGTYAIRDATLSATEAFERLRNTVQAPEFENSAVLRGMKELKLVLDDLAKPSQAPQFELGAVGRGAGIANAIIAAAAQAKTLAEEMQKHFSDAFVNIVTKGISSFRDLFSSIKDMFVRMAADLLAAKLMQKLTQPGADGGSSIIDKVSGAMGGWGGIAAGLGLGALAAGFSLLSGKSKEAADALEKMRQSVLAQVQDYTRTGESERDRLEREAMKRFTDLIDGMREAFRSGALSASEYAFQAQQAIDARDRELQKIAETADALGDFGKAAREQARAMEDLNVRQLRAAGAGGRADLFSFQNQQRREYEDAVSAGRSPEYLALLTDVQTSEAIQRAQQIEIERQTSIIQEAASAASAQYDAEAAAAQSALAVAQDQLRTQEQLVQSTQRAYDSIIAFAAGLKLNTSLTTLSPIQQATEARKQYEAQLALAKGGNADAAAGLGGYANTFLTNSQTVNATGGRYVADFNKVQSDLAALTTQYGGRLTTEQQILATLQSQVGTLQAQLQAVQAAKDAADANSRAQIAAINASSDNFRAAIENWHPEHTGGTGGTDGIRPDMAPVVTAIQDGNESNVVLLQAGFNAMVDRLDALESAINHVTSEVRSGAEADAVRGSAY